MATTSTTASSAAPTTSVALRRQCRTRSHRPKLAVPAIRDTPSAVAALSLIRHPGIQERIGQIYDQVNQDHKKGGDYRDSLDDRVIAAGDRLDQKLAQAGDRKDGLNDHRAAYQVTELQAEDRHHRDQGVAQGMPPQHHPLAQTLGTGRAHVI